MSDKPTHVIALPMAIETEYDEDGHFDFDAYEIAMPLELDETNDITFGRLFNPHPGYAYPAQAEQGRRFRELVEKTPVGRVREYLGRKFIPVTLESEPVKEKKQ